MALHNMQPQPAPLLPGAREYGDECIRRATAAARDIRVEWDQPYGSDPRQQLDVWVPENARGAPVCLFFHGGALRIGHKEWLGAHAPTITGAGAILVSANYRLTPHVRVVDIIADAFEALSWVRTNITRFGGDPDRIFLGGHSSGGHIAGLLATRLEDLTARDIPAEALQAALLCSSVVSTMPGGDGESDAARSMFNERFANLAEAEAATIFTHLGKTKVPFHVAFGERDAPSLVVQNWQLIGELARDRRLIGSDVIEGADHFAAHLACLDPNGPWMAKVRMLLA